MPLLIEKDKSISTDILRLFERTRVAYLSARTDPKEYGSKWRNAVNKIKEAYEMTDALSKELKDFIDEDLLEANDVSDPTTNNAEKVYEAIKALRYSSEQVSDPFSKKFKGNVLEALLDSPELMIKFVHYAIREDDKALPKEAYSIKDMKPDDITDGLAGLDLEVDDVALYIIEHYGDGKDSKKVETKVKAAMNMLELMFLSKNTKQEWAELEDIDTDLDETKAKDDKKEDAKTILKEKKSTDEKSQSDFIIPNKPMYRIFTIDDMNELKGFSGEYYVQEKYDGLRVQLHKIDKNIKAYDYTGKDISTKCKDAIEELKKKHFGDCILDASLVLFDGENALKRKDSVEYLAGKKEGTPRIHVFDVMRHNEENLMEDTLQNRMNIMFNNYSIHSSESLTFPSKKDTRLADNLKDVKEYADNIMEMPTAEGVVIKDSTSTYYLGTKKNPKWIRWKKFVELDLIVLDKKKNASNHSYKLGAGPVDEEKGTMKIDGNDYLVVGSATNTQVSADVGDIVRVSIDKVKEVKGKLVVYSAKINEIAESKTPDKLVSLQMLVKDTDKSLNYNVEEVEKGIVISDHIHGEANIIIKGDMDGFTIYGFEQDNLMAKNAIMDLDVWKHQAEEIMKTKQSRLTVAAFNYLKEKGSKTPKELHNFLVKNHKEIYQDILESKLSKVKDWMENRDGLSFDPKTKKLFAENDKILMDTIQKEYKTPEKYQQGKFKLYLRDDDNLNIVMKLGDESINWMIRLDSKDDIFELFGKAGKFPAIVAKNISKRKVIDSGDVKLGVQKEGYHEYFLDGNKFETKLHVRMLEVKGKRMWLAWTGYEQKPADTDSDKGVWNIYEDKFSSLKLPPKED